LGHDLKVLVTGAAGYLGSHVCRELACRGIAVLAVSRSGKAGIACDLTDPADVARVMGEARPDVVIHCAAEVPKRADEYALDDAADASFRMTENLLRACNARVVFASSMTVYPARARIPVFEEDAGEPLRGYARGKWRAERALLSSAARPVVILRLSGLFGPPRRRGALYAAADAFLSGREFRLDEPIPVWAGIEVRDAADYLARAALSTDQASSSVLNVGYAGESSLPAAVGTLARLLDVEWRHEGAAPVFAMHLDRLHAQLGLPKSAFGERLRELADWVRREREPAHAT
jgi:nucleoside-diphosphate-sugar epimerase